jgi:CubicO group peptidase (beta-lactamase class C family)
MPLRWGQPKAISLHEWPAHSLAMDIKCGFFPGEQRRFALIGVGGQMILVDPASKLVMVHTAVRQKPSDRISDAETIALWLGVLEQLGK